MRIFHFLSVLLWSTAVHSQDDICSNPPRDSCAFYADCLESQYHCGPDGYPIGYGQKYCQKFSDERDTLSEQGQNWMLDTMLCLQQTLVPDATDHNSSCTEIEETAFGSHARCYIDSGLCTLSPTDWVAIVDIVGITTLFSSADAAKASFEAAFGCLDFYLFLVEKDIIT